MRRHARRAAVALALAVGVPVGLLAGLNVFLNTGLLVLLNRQPERLSMSWAWAWTWDARHVQVDGYTLRAQGPIDQWWLFVDHADLSVELGPLLSRRFQADEVIADGVVVHYRTRVDAPPQAGLPPATYVEDRTAPIPGLENPPLERPEDLYPPPEAPWLVALDGVDVEDLREVWLGDYRFVGSAQATGELIVTPGASFDISGVSLDVLGGDLLEDDRPVLSDLALEAELSLEGVDPVRDAGVEIFRHLDGSVRFGARVDDLRYVDIFLRDAPWVGISGGSGRLDADLEVKDGALGPGSTARAVVRDLTVRLGTYAAVGEGRVDLSVSRGAHLGLVLDAFAVYQGGGSPLVKGTGFRLDASTPVLELYAAPSGFRTVATLPRSEVPDLARFDQYLPSDVGLHVLGGRASVAGRVRVEEDGDHVSGHLTFDAPEASLIYATIPVSGAVRLDGKVVRGSLDLGRYDIRGSSLVVDHVSVDGAPPTWWARLDVRDGAVAAGAKTFLSARAGVACSDSSPFFRMAVGNRPIAPWVKDLLLLHDLRGDSSASFGQTSVGIDHLEIHSPRAEVHLHLQQDAERVDALLFARLGLFGVATRIAGDTYTMQLVDAKRWFYARLAEAGTPETWTSESGVESEEAPSDRRKGITVLGANMRKLFKGKRGEGK
jgi:hypothetical protein